MPERAARFIAVLMLFSCAAVTASCSPAGARSAHDVIRIPLETTKLVLTNGMTVILDEDHRSPTVAVHLSFRVGSRDDPKGKSGLAHFVEHLSFLGSKNVDSGDHFKYLAEAGATGVNAETTPDRTYYFETVPSYALDLALWLESDRMAFFGAKLDEQAFDNERRVVENEHRQRVDDQEEGLVTLLERAELFPEGHPYHRAPIGTIAELDSVTTADAHAFHDAYYGPGNATLVLVGDFDTEKVKASILKYFGPIPKRAAAPPPPKATATMHGEKRLDVEASVDYPSIHVAWAMPPATSEDEPAIRIAQHLICGLVGYWQIFEHQRARESNCWYDADQLGGVAEIGFTLYPNTSFDEVLASIDTALTDMPDSRFGNVAIQRQRSESDLMFSFEDYARRADRFAFYDQVAGNSLFLATSLRRYAAVGRAAMTDAREKYFPAHDRVITFVHAVPSAPLAGRLVTK